MIFHANNKGSYEFDSDGTSVDLTSWKRGEKGDGIDTVGMSVKPVVLHVWFWNK